MLLGGWRRAPQILRARLAPVAPAASSPRMPLTGNWIREVFHLLKMVRSSSMSTCPAARHYGIHELFRAAYQGAVEAASVGQRHSARFARRLAMVGLLAALRRPFLAYFDRSHFFFPKPPPFAFPDGSVARRTKIYASLAAFVRE